MSIYGQDLTMYNMPFLLQRHSLNPAFVPKSKIQIGIPMLSSVGLSFSNSGFKYSDLVISSGDSLIIDPDNMLNKLDRDNRLIFTSNLEFITFGFRLKNNYLSFNITEHVHTKLNYPKDFFALIWEGNAADVERTSSFNFAIDAIHYRSYNIGFARTFFERLTLGAKLKYLYGMENITTKTSNISLSTNPDSAYALTVKSDIEVLTSGFGDTDNSQENYLFGRKNNGFGIDLGVNYSFSEKLSVNASALNLGKITWRSDIENYKSHSENTNFTYRGLPISVLTSSDSALSETTSDLLDSLGSQFNVDTNNASYSSALGAQYHLGLNFEPIKGQNLGFHWALNRLNGLSSNALSLYYAACIKRALTLSVSYTAFNGTFNNIGFGLRVNGGPVQWHIITDNVVSFFTPQHAQYFNVRTGLNLTFGNPDKVKDKKK